MTERLTIYVLPHMRQSWETMTSVSADRIILTPTQPVGSGRPQWESNQGSPHQESRALPTELPPPPPPPQLLTQTYFFQSICIAISQNELSYTPPSTQNNAKWWKRHWK